MKKKNNFKQEDPFIKTLRKQCSIRNKNKVVYLPKGTEITWIESNSVEVNDFGKTVLYDNIIKGFTGKEQYPIFNYKLRKDNHLVIRSGDTDYIYTVNNDVMFVNHQFRHPQDLRK